MSVVFLGYHEMGHECLRALIERGTEIRAVFTYRDSPDENAWFHSVADLARDAGLAVFITETINEPRWVHQVRDLQPGALISVHYRHLIKAELLGVPRFGCVNLHPSLLPRYRGRCPLNWQLVHGETRSGVTLHFMTERADRGDIVGQRAVDVHPDDTALELYEKLLPLGRELILEHIDGILDGTAPRTPQDESRATKFGGRRPEDGRIDWSRPAREIHNLVRAVAPPWPGAFTDTPEGRMMVLRSRVCARAPEVGALKPGQVVDHAGRTFAGTGDGVLELVSVSRSPKRLPITGARQHTQGASS